MSDDSPENHKSDPAAPKLSEGNKQEVRNLVSIEIIKPLWRGFVFGMSTFLGALTLSQLMKLDRDQLKVYIFANFIICLPIA
jgi:hypothetical protein